MASPLKHRIISGVDIEFDLLSESSGASSGSTTPDSMQEDFVFSY